MGAIEDLRKVIQDLITPDLKAIAAKLDMLEKRMDKLESSIEQKFERAERNADARLSQLIIVFGLEERIKRLEKERHQ